MRARASDHARVMFTGGFFVALQPSVNYDIGFTGGFFVATG